MPTLIVIAGPTASGKTSLAIKLAQHFSTQILSADSRQFYKGLDIGTAKPSSSELALIDHHFIDSHNITDDYNISDYEQDALKILESIFTKVNVAILTGGSGLYIRAVCSGIDEQPGRNDSIRKDLINIYESKGLEELRIKLKSLDPVYYNSVDLANPHRLIRALEVCLTTGKKFSDFRKNVPVPRPFNILKIGLLLSREVLYERIDKRVDQMITQGLVQEAQRLFPYRHVNALNTVGYKELFNFIDGKTTLEEAIDLIKQNTRNYAKRQMTWFRKEQGIKWFDPEDYSGILNYIESKLSA
ncbi:MAG TPA: tRNA (adenosine(37)-N6)-dimethylallyltransferase MiaA [Bacteroidia bacterium]|nr:tRNA (adenosine(37)-N6)-dimethylallyltransferase MiaA [Bacteroidia bacterium]